MNVPPEWYERALIGGVLSAPEKFYELTLTQDMFVDSSSRTVWMALEVLAEHGRTLDPISVAEQIGGDPQAIVRNFIEINVSGANLASYETAVKNLYRRRQAERTAQTLAEQLQQPGNGQAAIDEALTALLELSTQTPRYEFSLASALKGAFELIDAKAQHRGPEITTGLVDLDRALGGWHPGDLVVIAARPAMGKTALGLNFAAKAGVSVGMISTEQPASQIGLRMLSMQSGVSLQAMRTGELGEQAYSRLADAVSRLSDKTLWVLDHPSPKLPEIVAQSRKWRSKHGIRLLIVDYLQRIPVSGRGPRHEEIALIAQALKNLARELQITVIALAQINRNVESRPDKRPQLGDIRDSGMIEQEADQVISLYRDEEYDPLSADRGIAELDILKNRHGLTGVIKVAWLADSLRFENLAKE